MTFNKKSIATIALGAALVVAPAALANFVIGGNSATTGYGYGYGNCSTDGNGGYKHPCTVNGYGYGYGYGNGGVLGTTGSNNTNTSVSSSGGGSVPSYAYIGGTSMGLPQTTPTAPGTNTAGSNTVNGVCTPIFTARLAMGSKGPEVLKLQRFLNKLGASIPETGGFYKITRAAVRAFQSQQGFARMYGADHMSGNVFDITNAKLNEVYCASSIKL